MQFKMSLIAKGMIFFLITISSQAKDHWLIYSPQPQEKQVSLAKVETLEGHIQTIQIEVDNKGYEKTLLMTLEGRLIDLELSGVALEEIKDFSHSRPVHISFYKKEKKSIEGGIEVELGTISLIKQKKKDESIKAVQIDNLSADGVRTFRVAFINLSIPGRTGARNLNSTFISKFKRSIEEASFGRIKIVSSGRDIYHHNWEDGNCKQGPSIGMLAAREAIPDVFSRYDRVITHYPMELSSSCRWSGIASVGSVSQRFSANIVSVANKHVQVSIHEFGHSVGLGHSGYGSLQADGSFRHGSEYGDGKCYMGNNNDSNFLNPLHLETIEVLDNNYGLSYGEVGKSYMISELDEDSLANNEKVALRFENYVISFDESPYALSVRRKVSRSAFRVATMQPGRELKLYDSFNRAIGLKYDRLVDGQAQVSVGHLDEFGSTPFPLDETPNSEYRSPADFECVLEVEGKNIINENPVGIKQKYSKMTLKTSIKGNEHCKNDNARLRINSLDNSTYGVKLNKIVDFRNADFTKPYEIELDFPFERKANEEDLFTYILSFEGHSYFTKDFRKGHLFKDLTCKECPQNPCEIAPQVTLRANKNAQMRLVIASNTDQSCSAQDYRVNLDLQENGLTSYPDFLPQVSAEQQLSFDITLKPEESIYVPITAKMIDGVPGINSISVRNLLGTNTNDQEHTNSLSAGLINSSVLFGTVDNADPYRARAVVIEDVVGASGNSEDRLIIKELNQIYQDVLNRLPLEEGLNYWIEQHKNGVSFEKIRELIQNSPEAKLRALYLSHFEREPDTAGLNFWLEQLKKGMKIEEVRKKFRMSEECKKDCLNKPVDIVAELNTLYQRHLNRLPQAEGLRFWSEQYNNGMSLETIEGHIQNSNEAKLRRLYLNHLEREPDPAGLNFWMQQLNNGMSFNTVQSHFRKSDECKIDCL